MAVLITGATGFLGRHLLEALSEEGFDEPVWLLLRQRDAWGRWPWARSLEARLDTRILESELEQAGALSEHPGLRETGLESVYHLAAIVEHSREHADHVRRINVDGAQAVLRLASAFAARLAFMSTSGTVGCSTDAAAAPSEDAPYCQDVVGNWPYYASKIEAEKRLRLEAERSGVAMSMFRPPVLLGPGDHRFRSTSTIIRFLRRRLPFILDGGMHFVDVRDVAKALTRWRHVSSPAPVYHFRGCACSIDTFFRKVAAVAEMTPPRWRLPYRLAYALASVDHQLGQRWRGKPLGLFPGPVLIEMAAHYWGLASMRAERDLGYRSRAPDTTLSDTVCWLRQNHAQLQRCA